MMPWPGLWGRGSWVRIETEAGFWLVLALMLLLFPLRFLAGVVIAAAVHECGHILAIRLSGGQLRRICLRPGGASIETAPMTPGREALCALAGPAAGALTILLWRGFPELALAGLVQTVICSLSIRWMGGGQ